MTNLEKARSEYLDAVAATKRAAHSSWVRRKQMYAARAAFLLNQTDGNRREYERAKAIRYVRLRTYRRRRDERNRLRTAYKRLKNRPLRVNALAEAERLIGVTEQGGNNAGPIVAKIIRANGGTGPEPWCGDFVAYCYRRAGSKVVDRKWAAAHAGLWGWFTGVSRIKNLRNMKPGHIVEYSWQHTGLFDRWADKDAGTFWAIEGNTGAQGNTSDTTADGVRARLRNINDVGGGFAVRR